MEQKFTNYVFLLGNIVSLMFGFLLITCTEGTIWVRTQVMPRWLALVTYALALVLLISIGFTPWVVLVFPAWVFVISVYILILNYCVRDNDAENKG